MSCDCITRFIRKEYPKPCDTCLRVNSIIVMTADSPEYNGGSISVDLEDLTDAPSTCGNVEYSTFSYDPRFEQPVIDNGIVTITTNNNEPVVSGTLYKVILKAECTDSYLSTYFTIETEIKNEDTSGT